MRNEWEFNIILVKLSIVIFLIKKADATCHHINGKTIETYIYREREKIYESVDSKIYVSR